MAEKLEEEMINLGSILMPPSTRPRAAYQTSRVTTRKYIGISNQRLWKWVRFLVICWEVYVSWSETKGEKKG